MRRSPDQGQIHHGIAGLGVHPPIQQHTSSGAGTAASARRQARLVVTSSTDTMRMPGLYSVRTPRNPPGGEPAIPFMPAAAPAPAAPITGATMVVVQATC